MKAFIFKRSHVLASAERVRELLDYDPTTGLMKWRVARYRRVKAGAVAGYCNKVGRCSICVDGHTYFRSRLAWLWVHGEWPAAEIDHIDRNPANDRFSNLREASHAENNQNKLARKSSGVRGVAYRPNRRKPWRARIYAEGRLYYIGSFATEEEASAAYEAAAKVFHGKFYATDPAAEARSA